MALKLVIGTKRISSWSLRPWLGLKVAGIGFDEELIPLRQPETQAEILKHSPSGKVPLLKDGEVVVWDSLAILDYAAERFPEAGLWPADRVARAMARSLSAEMHAGFAALRQTCPMDVLSVSPLTEIPDEVKADLTRIEAGWTEARSRFGADGPFLFGRFSVADAMYAPVVTRIHSYALPVGTVAEAYCRTIMELPAMAEWIGGAR